MRERKSDAMRETKSKKKKIERTNKKSHQKPSNTTMASNGSSLPPPMFAGENYHMWPTKMRTYLKSSKFMGCGGKWKQFTSFTKQPKCSLDKES